MAWSERAISDALRVFFTDVVMKDGTTRMRAALDAAAAVGGDAQSTLSIADGQYDAALDAALRAAQEASHQG